MIPIRAIRRQSVSTRCRPPVRPCSKRKGWEMTSSNSAAYLYAGSIKLGIRRPWVRSSRPGFRPSIRVRRSTPR